MPTSWPRLATLTCFHALTILEDFHGRRVIRGKGKAMMHHDDDDNDDDDDDDDVMMVTMMHVASSRCPETSKTGGGAAWK